MNEFTQAAAGGAIIGIASVMLLALTGRIAGISGITFGMLTRAWRDNAWRALFIVGLIAGGFLYQQATGEPLVDRTDQPLALTALAGLLVGFGTRLGSGCTSGHGICGISRLSLRSVVATALFVAIGMITATAVFALQAALR